MDNKLCRIAVFYDGTYFFKVSNYYLYQHERKARLSIKGLHEFIVAEVARSEGVSEKHCQIIDAAYFRGRLTAQQAQEQDKLYGDRLFEDVLMRADVTLFQHLLAPRPDTKIADDKKVEEKGIDVLFALEAYEMTSLKKYDVCVLITGDGDFVPLVRKLNTLGARVMLLGWDFEYEYRNMTHRTQVATSLLDRVNYPVMMDKEIDGRERRNDRLIDGLFMPRITENNFYRPVTTTGEKDNNEAGERQGTVLSFFAEKGYGFIKPSNGGDNYFFHVHELVEWLPEDLTVGQNVTFIGDRTEKGLIAKAVRPCTP